MCYMSHVMSHVSHVKCHVSCVMCRMLRVTCHLSLTPIATATAKDPTPANFPIIRSKLFCKTKKTEIMSKQKNHHSKEKEEKT